MNAHYWNRIVSIGMALLFSGSCGESAAEPQEEQNLLSLTGEYFGQEPPGDTPRVFAPGIISGGVLHATPSFTPDGREIYWAVFGNGPGMGRIWFSRLTGDRWSQPELAPFAATEHGDSPVVSPDGQTLVFNSSRALNGESRERLWAVRRDSDGSWSDPSPLDGAINDHALHWQTSLDREGGIYFGSERSPNHGSDDIFYSEYRDGHFQEPENLGPVVNSSAHESMPYVDPDGRFLLFSRLVEGSSAGIFLSRRETDGTWGQPVSISDARPDVRGECPQLTPDGRYLFFLRYESGVFNVYWVDAGFLEEMGGS